MSEPAIDLSAIAPVSSGTMHPSSERVPVTGCETLACKIPTDAPESDGTLEWGSTTIVMVVLEAGGKRGLGYTFSHAAAARLIHDKLLDLVRGADAMATEAVHQRLLSAVRNLGREGIAACAISAIDVALWDLKANILAVPLARLLGGARQRVPVYGSGGFTSYDMGRLRSQLARFRDLGMRRVKMKVGRDPATDPSRVAAARDAIGSDVALMVDGNGAYDESRALCAAEIFARFGVDWFEEPVSSDDLAGLRALTRRKPPGMEIAAGEYGYDPWYFRRMLESKSVDVLQADATRCLGYTGFLKVAALCEAFNVPLSAHTAPFLHVPCCCAAAPVRHIEYFHDHERIAHLLFDGLPRLTNGALAFDPGRSGHGLVLKRSDAEKYAQHVE